MASCSGVFIPRLKCSVPAETVNIAILHAVQQLGYDHPTPEQGAAIREFLLGKDVFVSLPTGGGKSLCYASLPLAFDYLLHAAGEDRRASTIAVVVSPLTSLMKDQVMKFTEKGLKCAFVGDEQHDVSVKDGVVSGGYQLVYISPESLLRVLRWREMFRSAVYQEHLVALAVDEAHLVEKWGSGFREEFAHISEARSIVPANTNVIALTATASLHTRKIILDSLCMKSEPFVLTRIPNKLNIFYSIATKPAQILDVIRPIIIDAKRNDRQAQKTLIFCKTYQECIDFFVELTTELDEQDALFVPSTDSPNGQEHFCQMFTACTAEDTKDYIMKSFMDPAGAIRVVIATIAFGLGVDCPNIRTILHWGASKSIDAYTQETGRSGRDGLQSRAILYLSENDQTPTEDGDKTSTQDQSMKAYCTNKMKCRRLVLMSEFASESDIKRPVHSHDCCDICQRVCTCESCTNATSVAYTLQKEDIDDMEVETVTTVLEPLSLSTIPPETQHRYRVQLREKLYKFRESLCSDAVDEDGHTVPLLFGIELVTGLHDKLIDRIVGQFEQIREVADLLSLGVSSVAQAEEILHIIHSVL